MRRLIVISLLVLSALGATLCLPTSPSATRHSKPSSASVLATVTRGPLRLRFVAPPSGSLEQSATTSTSGSSTASLTAPSTLRSLRAAVLADGHWPVPHPPVLAPAVTQATPTSSTPPTAPVTTSTGWTYDQAQRVALCEEEGFGGPPARGPTYYGWLGISARNWAAYGCGTDYYSVDANIACASSIQPYPPDQDGCGGSW